MNTEIHQSRSIEQLIAGVLTSDGAGVKLTRVLTGKLQRRLDPFLMLDAFGSDVPDDYIAGFPDHPHRGFETVTYMLSGRMRHRDNAGHEGLLQSGGVQWMTAGRGLIHSEMPEQIEGVMEGLQLWLNLPAKRKMNDPWYQDFDSGSIPEYVTAEGVTVRVIAGKSGGIEGVITREDTEPLFLDVHLPGGATFATTLPATHNAFIYVYRGEVVVGDTIVTSRRMGILSNTPGADGITLTATNGHVEVSSTPDDNTQNTRSLSPTLSRSAGEGANESLRDPHINDTRLILIAGKPLNEPVVQYGPFVMNTQEEINQALDDYRNGRFI
ncbi:MAG: pirin family protein [Gallionella sp.]|nr:pirin family protein [Gallionella sp.]